MKGGRQGEREEGSFKGIKRETGKGGREEWRRGEKEEGKKGKGGMEKKKQKG